MKNDFNTYDINQVITQARNDRSNALGTLIGSGTRKALAWSATRANRFLHAFLMTPVNPR